MPVDRDAVAEGEGQEGERAADSVGDPVVAVAADRARLVAVRAVRAPPAG